MNPFSDFKEFLSPFLKEKLQLLKDTNGIDHWRYQSLARQFYRHEAEKITNSNDQERHYFADLGSDKVVDHNLGLERLYRRSVVLELSTACFAHCRWCLRSHYHRFSLSKETIMANLKLLSTDLGENVREILITGGDPLVNLSMLNFALKEIACILPNIDIVRIGTRAFTSNPSQFDATTLRVLDDNQTNFVIELGTQINSPVEFFPETIAAIKNIKKIGISIYNQHPLLKGVNDNVDVLVELYDTMRYLGVESHYLFHCVPMIGMQHHRTSIHKGLELIRQITSGGYFSGRNKPHYTAMTPIGKIGLYQGTVVEKDIERNRVLLRSGYSLNKRLEYNPSFQLPPDSFVDSDGFINVWYLDGIDDNFWQNC